MTAPMGTVCIVVPCFNERARLDGELFVKFAEQHDRVRFLFVDDGSSDGTGALLAEIAARNPQRIRALSLPANAGKAEAVRHGFVAAFTSTEEPACVGFWDADLATPLADVLTFADVLAGNERLLAVIGSRVNLLGRDVKRNLVRHYVGRVFATAAASVLRLPVYDTQCGAKLFRNTPAVRAAFAQPFVSGWIFDVEILARLGDELAAAGGPRLHDVLYEHPLMQWRDVRGSKVRFFDFFKAAAGLVRIAWRPRRSRR